MALDLQWDVRRRLEELSILPAGFERKVLACVMHPGVRLDLAARLPERPSTWAHTRRMPSREEWLSELVREWLDAHEACDPGWRTR